METQGPLGRREGRTDGGEAFCMARARTTRGRRRAGAAEAVPGDFHNAVHISLFDSNHLNSSNVSAIRVIISVSVRTSLLVIVMLVIQTSEAKHQIVTVRRR